MLEALSIKNFAIIEDIEINFKSGMNVLLGETGAGKSIIIDALALLKGERSSFEKIRTGSTRAYIDGKFIIDNKDLIKEINEEYDGLIEDGELIVSRSLDISGRTSIKLNGRMFSSASTKAIMNEIIDIHSQHQTLMLFDEREHLNLLDKFIGEKKEFNDYKASYQKYIEEKNKLEELENKVIDETEIAYKKSQIAEIEKLNLEPGELDKLENLEKKMANFVRLQEAFNNIDNLLDGDNGAIGKIYESRRLIDYLRDDDYEEYSTKLNDIYYSLQDINSALQANLKELNEYEYTPEYISERIYNIKRVMRKFGNAEEDIFKAHEKLVNELAMMSDYEYALSKQKEVVANLYLDIMKKGEAISLIREKFATTLNKKVDQELSDLNLNNAHFKVVINQTEPRSSGINSVVFYISSNIGMPYGPLKDIVSGGESSRIMLGLKTIFSKFSNVETMIFDEIDSGVSGKVASSVGRKLHNIGQDCQVIVISHIPQVASFADVAYEISKFVSNGTTKTKIVELNEDGFKENIAKLLTDNLVSNESLALAKELITNSRK
ncbi:MAG: DNA repair protein RecN [Erysipelotrichales bacterium]|nr:DNA repair protein RecN [Erysipelotrichales bacterium]